METPQSGDSCGNGGDKSCGSEAHERFSSGGESDLEVGGSDAYERVLKDWNIQIQKSTDN